MTKSAYKNITLNAAENSGLLNLLQKTGRGSDQYLYVLTYHRVEELTVTPGWIQTRSARLRSNLEIK